MRSRNTIDNLVDTLEDAQALQFYVKMGNELIYNSIFYVNLNIVRIRFPLLSSCAKLYNIKRRLWLEDGDYA